MEGLSWSELALELRLTSRQARSRGDALLVWLQEAAASTSSTITGATFSLVGSIFDATTGTVNGTTLAGMSDTVSDNIPVYNTLGQLVAANSVSF